MDTVMAIFNFCKDNLPMIIFIYSCLVTIASWIVKITPTLKDDAIVLPIIKFLAKYIAVNTNAPTERPK
jgi:hypothetical protein